MFIGVYEIYDIMCEADDFSSHTIQCSDGYSKTIKCFGRKYKITITCPIRYSNSSLCTQNDFESFDNCKHISIHESLKK